MFSSSSSFVNVLAVSYVLYTYSNSVKYVESEGANSIYKAYTLLKLLQMSAPE